MPTWDLPLVLEAVCLPPFERLSRIELKWFSLRTSFLLAVTSVKHVGGLNTLSVDPSCLRWNLDGSGVTLVQPRIFPQVLLASYVYQAIEIAAYNPSPFRKREEATAIFICVQ